MNLSPTKTLLVLVLVATNAWLAAAQSNEVAAVVDYASFSRVITERNIFDPNRFAHTTRTTTRTTYRPRTRSNSAPAFSLVGTMSYEKGMFAFFSGNNADLKKILVLNESIAGYTATEITATLVKLETADKKIVVMKLGDLMRQESGHWELAGPGEVPTEASAAEPAKPGTEEGAAPAATEAPANPAAASGGAASEILKRLMQKREQESK